MLFCDLTPRNALQTWKKGSTIMIDPLVQYLL